MARDIFAREWRPLVIVFVTSIALSLALLGYLIVVSWFMRNKEVVVARDIQPGDRIWFLLGGERKVRGVARSTNNKCLLFVERGATVLIPSNRSRIRIGSRWECPPWQGSTQVNGSVERIKARNLRSNDVIVTTGGYVQTVQSVIQDATGVVIQVQSGQEFHCPSKLSVIRVIRSQNANRIQ